jgi:uncharacterized protein (DUF2237 family)
MAEGRNDQRNVFGEPLSECCSKPLTGFYRNGNCETGPDDVGVHTVCARVDAEFLAFSKAAGNDLSTPMPAAGLAGRRPVTAGACAPPDGWKPSSRQAPRVRLTGMHEATLEIVPLDL